MQHRIILIENNANLRQLLCSVLRHHGYMVDVANRLEPGIQALLNNAPDLILLGLDIPAENPLDAITFLTAERLTHDIPVIAFTRRCDCVTMNESCKRGASWVFNIPVTARELLKKVSVVLHPPETIWEQAKANQPIQYAR